LHPSLPQKLLLGRHVRGSGSFDFEDGFQGSVFFGKGHGAGDLDPAVVGEEGRFLAELEDDGDGLLLDGCRCGISLFFEGSENRPDQLEVVTLTS
jgi:hypothetical protein